MIYSTVNSIVNLRKEKVTLNVEDERATTKILQ